MASFTQEREREEKKTTTNKQTKKRRQFAGIMNVWLAERVIEESERWPLHGRQEGRAREVGSSEGRDRQLLRRSESNAVPGSPDTNGQHAAARTPRASSTGDLNP